MPEQEFAAAEAAEPLGVKIIQTSIDRVENGGSELYSEKRVKKGLPDGITNRMLDRDILRIGWPSLVELALTQLTAMVDMMMVGRLGDWAISAVGLCNQPKFLMMMAFMALQVGATAVIARYRGSGEREKAQLVLRQSLAVVFILALVCGAAGYVFARQFMLLMGAKTDDVLLPAISYLRIQMLGFPVLALTSVITAALRGVGNSKVSMRYNLVANLVNIGLNWVFIFGNLGAPRMEVAGASLATIISQFAAMLLAFGAITRKDQYLRLSLEGKLVFSRDDLVKTFRVGVPAMVEQLVLRIGVIICVRTIASLGTTEYATYQVCINILSLSFMLGQAYSVSAVSLVGQSMGKFRPDMAQAYARRCQLLGIFTAVLLGSLMFLSRRFLVSLYSDIPQVIADGAMCMVVVALIQPFQAQQLILAGVLRGAGDTRSVAIITGFTVMIMRPVLTVFAIRQLGLGLMGAWYAFFTDQFVRSLLVQIRFLSGRWKKDKL